MTEQQDETRAARECPICGYASPNREHIRACAAKALQLACPECGARFETKRGLKVHRSTVHGRRAGDEFPGVDYDGRYYICTACGYENGSKRNIIEHVAACVAGELRHACPECGARFATLHGVRIHAAWKHDGFPRTCPKCGYRCRSVTRAKKHVEACIAGKLQHECPECGARFANARACSRHMAHAHPREYTCRFCGHVTGDKRAHARHVKICADAVLHANNTLNCYFCSATFDKWTALQAHFSAEHPDEPAETPCTCVVCGREFDTPVGRRMHEIRAHGYKRQVPARDVKEDTE
jgi:rubredoxin